MGIVRPSSLWIRMGLHVSTESYKPETLPIFNAWKISPSFPAHPSDEGYFFAICSINQNLSEKSTLFTSMFLMSHINLCYVRFLINKGMSSENYQTQNISYVNKWSLALLRTPSVQYTCTEVTFPNLSLNPISLPSPVGKHHVGGKIAEFGQFGFTFIVDEDFNNYYSVFEWMVGIAGAVDMINYKNLINDQKHNVVDKSGHNIYSDGTLLSLTNASQVNREFAIRNMFPVSLGSPKFSRSSNEPNVCDVTFQCDYFELVPKKA